MSKDADPLQGVVTADNGVRQSGPKGPQRAVTAETPDARLRRYIRDFGDEARREQATAKRTKRDRYVSGFYDGEIYALRRLVDWLNEERAASGVGGNR